MASYSKRKWKNGKEVVDVSLYVTDPATGRSKQVLKRGFKSMAAAELYVAEVTYKQHHNLFAAPNQVTLGEYLEYWMETYVKRELKRSTIASHGKYIDNQIVPRLGGYKLQELRPLHIRSFYYDLLEKGHLRRENRGLSLSTIRQIRAILNKALRDAVRDELIARQPGVDVPLPKCKRLEPEKKKHFTDEEIDELAEKIRGHRHELLIMLTMFSGMRRGEVLGLTWDKIDLKTGDVQITETINVDRDRTLYVDTPKSQTSNRPLKFPERVLRLLRAAYKKRFDACVVPLHQEEKQYVFCEPDGSPINPDTASAWVKKTIKQLGLPALTIHGLRHTNATYLIGQGEELVDVAAALGHSKVSTTLDIYAHSSPKKVKEMARHWDKFL